MSQVSQNIVGRSGNVVDYPAIVKPHHWKPKLPLEMSYATRREQRRLNEIYGKQVCVNIVVNTPTEALAVPSPDICMTLIFR